MILESDQSFQRELRTQLRTFIKLLDHRGYVILDDGPCEVVEVELRAHQALTYLHAILS